MPALSVTRLIKRLPEPLRRLTHRWWILNGPAVRIWLYEHGVVSSRLYDLAKRTNDTTLKMARDLDAQNRQLRLLRDNVLNSVMLIQAVREANGNPLGPWQRLDITVDQGVLAELVAGKHELVAQELVVGELADAIRVRAYDFLKEIQAKAYVQS